MQSVRGRIFVIVTLLGCLSTVTGFLGRLGALFELTSHFRLQYFWGLAICTFILAVQRKSKMAAVTGGFALVNLALLVPYYSGASLPPSGARTYRGLLLNVGWRNDDYHKVMELARSQDPDIIMLLEITPQWTPVVKKLRTEYPFVRSEPREGGTGLAFMSRIPMESSIIRHFGDETRPAVIAHVELDQHPLTVIGLHPQALRDKAMSAFRRGQIEGLARLVATRKEPLLVLADLNLTPWAPLYQELIETSDLRDGRQGFGLYPTWPAVNFPPLMIPIDHCLVTPGVLIHDYRTGPFVGSDHLPLIVDFSVPMLWSSKSPQGRPKPPN